MTNIKIPASIEAVKTKLAALDALVTAKQWERAAIVWAFVKPQRGARTDLVGNPTTLTIRDFARLGIAGLRHHETVATYHAAWQSAIDKGKATEVKPGESVTLPDMEWPPTGHTSGSVTKQLETVSPETLVKQVTGVSPAKQTEIVRALVAKMTPAVAKQVIPVFVLDHEAEVRKQIDEVDQATAVNAVAAARQIEPAKVDPREVKMVKDIARTHAIEKDTPVAKPAQRIADTVVRLGAAGADRKALDKKSHSFQCLAAQANMNKIRHIGGEILKDTHGVQFTDDELEMLNEDIGRVRALVTLLELRFNKDPDTSTTDWDSEYEKLMGKD